MTKKQIATSLASLLTLMAAVSVTADEVPVSAQIVDAMNKLYGVHPGFRAVHAKGVVVEGSFKSSAEARRLSRAKLFSGHPIPVTVRFSDGGGAPDASDGSPDSNPHGIAVKFHLPDGSDTDMELQAYKFFPVGTGEDFRDLLQAILASPPDAPKPTKFDQFVAAHPNAPQACGSVATPDSFADEEYYSVNAFVFVNKAGHKQAVRYVAMPEKLVHLTPDEAGKKAPDFLVDELPTRIAQRPVVFHLKAQLAGPGDPTNDASRPWPETRKVVELGVLTLTKSVPDSRAAQKELQFMPTNLTDGIELSDDPLVVVRAAAYAVSIARRSQ